MRVPIVIPRISKDFTGIYGYIYIITNLITGKQYIGQHNKPEFDCHYYGSGKLICMSVNKYGKDKFVVEVIDTAESKEDLDNKEKYWIEFTMANIDTNHWYNIKSGGEGWSSYDVSGSKNPMFGVRMCGEDNPNYNNTWDSEQRKRMSKRVSGKGNPNWGKPMSDEQKYKIKMALIGKTGHSRKPIVQLTMDNEFVAQFDYMEQVSETNDFFGAGASNYIRQCCRHKKNSYKGYKWMFLCEYETEVNNK